MLEKKNLVVFCLLTNLNNVCVGDSWLGNIMDTSVFLSVNLSVHVDNIFNVLTLIDTIKKKEDLC